jgi:hypothetical protein
MGLVRATSIEPILVITCLILQAKPRASTNAVRHPSAAAVVWLGATSTAMALEI